MVKIRLAAGDAAARAARIVLVLTDCDGVLTDAGVYVSPQGEAMKRFSMRDGMGMELLRQAGIETRIVTAEDSEIVKRRGEKLKLAHVYLGIKNKAAQLDKILENTGLSADQVAYIGDDVNDEAVMQRIAAGGLTGAPRDAVAKILDLAHFVSEAPGGHGAFRQFADWILGLREAETKVAGVVRQGAASAAAEGK